jgi:hypothetical protein
VQAYLRLACGDDLFLGKSGTQEDGEEGPCERCIKYPRKGGRAAKNMMMNTGSKE